MNWERRLVLDEPVQAQGELRSVLAEAGRSAGSRGRARSELLSVGALPSQNVSDYHLKARSASESGMESLKMLPSEWELHLRRQSSLSTQDQSALIYQHPSVSS